MTMVEYKRAASDDPFFQPFAPKIQVLHQLPFCFSINSKYVRALIHDKGSAFFSSTHHADSSSNLN